MDEQQADNKEFVYSGQSTRIRDFRVGEVYHVYQRGNDGKKTFLDPEARIRYLQRLWRLARRHKVRVHNFCLMHNHVHFVLEPQKQDGISRMMQALQPQHAKQHNRKLNKTGNLWTQHFGCRHVASEVYYRTVMKYVENNPVVLRRAGQAVNYQWSGAMAHAMGAQVIITVGEITVETELYLEGWRDRCGEQIAQGWVRFLAGRYEDAATLKQIEAMLDGKMRQQMAQQERAKRNKEEKEKRDKLNATEKAPKAGEGSGKKRGEGAVDGKKKLARSEKKGEVASEQRLQRLKASRLQPGSTRETKVQEPGNKGGAKERGQGAG